MHFISGEHPGGGAGREREKKRGGALMGRALGWRRVARQSDRECVVAENRAAVFSEAPWASVISRPGCPTRFGIKRVSPHEEEYRKAETDETYIGIQSHRTGRSLTSDSIYDDSDVIQQCGRACAPEKIEGGAAWSGPRRL